MLIPKLTAPSPADCVLGGCQERDTKAAAVKPPIKDADGYLFPLS